MNWSFIDAIKELFIGEIMGRVKPEKRYLGLFLRSLSKSIERTPGEARLYLARGYFFDMAGDLSKADQDFRKARELDPEAPIARGNPLRALYRLGFLDKGDSLVEGVTWDEVLNGTHSINFDFDSGTEKQMK